MKLPRFSGKRRNLKPLILVRRVQGTSMAPGLSPGTLVWASGWFRKLRPGDIVVFAHNDREKIKRVDRLEDDRIFVTGDNPAASTDSRQFGWLESDVVKAKLVWPSASGRRGEV